MNQSLLIIFLILSVGVIGVIPDSYALTATGGTITYSGPYTIHTFTSSGNFTVSFGPGNVEYLIIGGGGSGGGLGGNGAGGGGAGGWRDGTTSVTTGTYSVIVGAGGAGVGSATIGNNGSASSFNSLTSNGGGGGGIYSSDGVGGATGGTGGSGAGGGHGSSGGVYGGGGGSPIAAGGNGGGTAGLGANGKASTISGASVTYAAGGQGALATTPTSASGIGGKGSSSSVGATAGAANTGSGGGGAYIAATNSGAGGSGIVIIRYIASSVASPYAVTDLDIISATVSSVLLNWTAPYAGSASQSIIGYQINGTTPTTSNPLVLVNDTGSTDHFYNATGLTAGLKYSFRVSAWTNNTGGHPYNNATGNVKNANLITPGVYNLTGTATSFGTIELSWSTPTGLLPITGYMINYTTPYGNPTTKIINDTGTTDTNYEIFGLSETTGYSFRVGPWSGYGTNGTGNIFNATTVATFDIGNINVPTGENPDRVDISFTRNDVNSTQSIVTVKFPNTVSALDCNLGYQFARTNNTYSNLTSSVLDADYNTTSFTFNGVENEIINFRCYDPNNSNVTGRYIITQTGFPLLDEINNFRNGTYGTMGMFGVVDFITLVVIIFSMIGFNRVNEAVGIIFNIMLVGALGYFGIISVPTIVFGAMAVIVMFAITSARKD